MQVICWFVRFIGNEIFSESLNHLPAYEIRRLASFCHFLKNVVKRSHLAKQSVRLSVLLPVIFFSRRMGSVEVFAPASTHPHIRTQRNLSQLLME